MLAATASPCATRLTVAVSRPERCICQPILSSTQPEYIAKRGTSGMPISTDMLGSVQLPEVKVWVYGPAPVVAGAPNAAFSQWPKASASIGTTTSPSAVTASWMGAAGSRPPPSRSELSSGCSAPSEVLTRGIAKKPLAGGTP